ncbi:MAG: phosphodiester glycosidase family protein [Planctomycetota bacterium]
MAAWLIYLAVGLGLLAPAFVLGWLAWRWRRRRTVCGACALPGAAALALSVMPLQTGGLILVGTWRSQPPDITSEPFDGVRYDRLSLPGPPPAVIHRVIVDLTRDQVDVVVTPPDQPGAALPVVARTTSAFLEEHGLTLAINGNFFGPFADVHPWHDYPDAGSPTNPNGWTYSDSLRYGFKMLRRPLIGVDTQGRWRSGLWNADVDWAHAVTGLQWVVRDGLPTDAADQPYAVTILGYNADRTELIIVVIDGKQPRYSEGLEMADLQALLIDAGCHDAVQLDGGGSATLVIADPDGRAIVLNSPSHNRVPGRERPVATHLGLRINPKHSAGSTHE